jgi:hypothetical protein
MKGIVRIFSGEMPKQVDHSAVANDDCLDDIIVAERGSI